MCSLLEPEVMKQAVQHVEVLSCCVLTCGYSPKFINVIKDCTSIWSSNALLTMEGYILAT